MWWIRSGYKFTTCAIVSLCLVHIQCTLGVSLKNFVSQSCKGSNNELHLEHIALHSNGSRLIVTGNLGVGSTLEAPIKTLLKMERRVFFRWIKIPCVGNFGSCNYLDLCTLLDQFETCVEDLDKEQTIPCKCPIYKGNYTISIESEHKVISNFASAFKGNYRASLEMFKNAKSVACFNLKFKIAT